MIANELISYAIPALKTSDTIQKVIDRMLEFRVTHLPIVNNEQFLGLLSEDDTIEVENYDTPVGALSLSLMNPYIFNTQHIYDAIRVFYEQRITVLPVLDHQLNYIGLISINSMVDYMANLTAVSTPGSIIVLEINNRDNSLAHMAQVVESENAQILSSYTDSAPNSTKLTVTLKINKTEISQIVASFLRYDYTVLSTHNATRDNDSTLDRFDSLMNYLSF
jgi:predicted transcriptional regulator